MTSALTRHYVPKRLRRWGRRTATERLRPRRVADTGADVLANAINQGFGRAIEVQDSEEAALGATDFTRTAGQAITGTEFPDGNRDEPLTMRMVGVDWDADANGLMCTMGDVDDGFAIWMAAGSILRGIAFQGGVVVSDMALQLPPTATAAEIWACFTATRRGMFIGWRAGATDAIQFQVGKYGGSGNIAPAGQNGVYAGADTTHPNALQTGPAAGLALGTLSGWLNSNILAA